MKSIVLFPCVEEAAPFLLTEPRVPVFVAGADPAEMAAGTVRAIRAKKPHWVVLASLAAASDRSIPLGSVVEVVAARMEAGSRDYEATGPATGLREVAALTLGGARSGGCTEREEPPQGAAPQTQIVDRGGALFFAVCEAMQTPCSQLCAVSHYCGETPVAEQTQAARRNLVQTLERILTQITETYG